MRPDSLRIRELRVDGMRTVLREAGGQATGKRPSSFTATPAQAPTRVGLLHRAGGVCRAVA